MAVGTSPPLREQHSPASRSEAQALDAADPLAPLRALFALPAGLIYLDGNSLGALPVAAQQKVQQAVTRQWGEQLIASWNSAGWIDLPARLGARIAGLIGADPDQVVVADSTSVNLFKLLSVALQADRERTVVLSESGNFPTDLYVAQGLIRQLGDPRGDRHELRLVERDEIGATLDSLGARTAVLMLTQVDYRTGSKLDMAQVTRQAQRHGALVIWDLAHSAGAFDVQLDACNADFAVGCGYKYLNGGPGAPAFLYVARRHQPQFAQPLAGWHGHRQPFAFETQYQPAQGVARYLCGTPPVLSMVALEAGLDTFAAAQPLGGMAQVQRKSQSLTGLFAARLQALSERHGLRIRTPLEPERRGSQISFSLPEPGQSYALVQALIEAGVVGDFRAPDICRFGFAPLYNSHVEAWDAAEKVATILADGCWREPRFSVRKAVT